MKKINFVDIIASLYIMLLMYTGIFKLLGLKNFYIAIAKSPIIKKWAFIAAPAIPIIELIIASLLLIPMFVDRPKLRKWGLLAGASLMAMFTIYIYYMLHFESDVPCTCGGIIQKMTWKQHLYFNSVFTILGFIGYWLNNRQQQLEQRTGNSKYNPEYQKA